MSVSLASHNHSSLSSFILFISLSKPATKIINWKLKDNHGEVQDTDAQQVRRHLAHHALLRPDPQSIPPARGSLLGDEKQTRRVLWRVCHLNERKLNDNTSNSVERMGSPISSERFIYIFYWLRRSKRKSYSNWIYLRSWLTLKGGTLTVIAYIQNIRSEILF